MPSPVHIILNARAGRLAKDPALLARITELSRGRARVWVTRDLAGLDSAARAIADQPCEAVVLCGGDGTFMAGVTAVVHASADRPLPAFALAPAGTVASVARNWGESEDALSIVERVLSEEPSSIRPRPTLRIEERHGATRVGFTVGTGLVARFFERYYEAGAGGHGSALRIVARIFAGSLVGDAYSRSVLEPLPCALTVDGVLGAPRAYSLIVCSVLRDLGLHMLVTYRGGEDPERPHLVASALSTRKLGPQAPRALLGKPLRGRQAFDGLVGRFEVEFPNGRGPYVLDGDMFQSSAIEVRAGPVIRVITALPRGARRRWPELFRRR